MDEAPWSQIEREAQRAFLGAGRFPLRAYSEFMPPPYVGLKPYARSLRARAASARARDGDALEISEHEQAQELDEGLPRIGAHVVRELGRLMAGDTHALSRTLLTGNPAWPSELAEAAANGALKDDPLVLLLAIALSRTQDDLGNVRWTLFGNSHEGAAAPFWRSLAAPGENARDRLDEILAWAVLDRDARILEGEAGLPEALASLCVDGASLAGTRTLITFRPFAELPRSVQSAYLARELALVPCPASLVFFHHPRYAELAKSLPHATQIPLLHLFPRVEQSCTIRIPQSGWLDETDPSQADHHHRIANHVRRTHRWERVARHERDVHAEPDGKYTDKVSVALFSTDPDVLELYGKPMARNAQIWTRDYALLLDGPRADRDAIARAAHAADAGGHFGYRFVYPAMRAGARELYWHLPVIARRAGPDGADVMRGGPLGYVTAERDGEAPLVLAPRLLDRPEHHACVRCQAHEPGRTRFTTSDNARKILEMRELLDAALPPSFARSLLRIAKPTTLEAWLAQLPDVAGDRLGGARLSTSLRHCLADDDEPGAAITLAAAGSRAFEESIWRTLAMLSGDAHRQRENADGISVNAGKHGGPAAEAAHIRVTERRDLEPMGELLHARYRALFAAQGMEGRAEIVDHEFRWETDFDYPWMLGWAKNQKAAAERNVICVIPGHDRSEAVIMADHYDTAYMEDVYDADRGGDGLRAAAAGADDNGSATNALLMAAEALLPLAREGKLERDVWLVHLTGEEFPSDSLGARALAQALVEGRLAFTNEDGSERDVHDVRVVGAYVLDMIGHNSDRDRDVFQIAPGEGAASARLALRAHRANQRWNRAAASWNQEPERARAGRAQRMADGSVVPPLFSHLALSGEVRVEWEPRSALYNTDGQAFSDVGVPVVLFMENYDINRTGYHDTLDTMANIDLDYCAAMTAIAIESVADAACAKKV